MGAGFVQFAKPIVLAEMTKSIQERIDHLQYRYDTFHKLIPILKKFDGKKVTKRLETALKEAFPEDRIHLRYIGSMTYIDVIGKGKEYADKESFFVCYDSEGGIYVEENFSHKHNGDIENILECIRRLKQGLIEAPALVERYNKILKEAQVLVVDASTVGMEYDFDILSRNRN
jgi:hypothetical protein